MTIFILFSDYPNPSSRNIAPSRAQHQRRRLKFPQRLQQRRCRRRRGLGLHGLGGLDGLGLGRLVVVLVVLVGLAQGDARQGGDVLKNKSKNNNIININININIHNPNHGSNHNNHKHKNKSTQKVDIVSN